jgi:hypothetical protein
MDGSSLAKRSMRKKVPSMVSKAMGYRKWRTTWFDIHKEALANRSIDARNFGIGIFYN